MSRNLFNNQDYYQLKNECAKKKQLFCDDLFRMDVSKAKWVRPGELVSNPQFFVGGASRLDVRQGSSSDCWLLVAMANLTMNPTLFDHVVPKDQNFSKGYAGIFRFNFWQCGKWTEVVVDDRLPVKDKNGKLELMFTHSKEKNEFWSALLEKAYAKLYGSYNELTTGWFNEAMVDFTGGMVERLPLKPPPNNVATILYDSLLKSAFMCVFMINDPSIKEMILPNGLVKGHAYSLTRAEIVEVDGKRTMLLRLRNPWGRIEWKGAFSDGSPEWTHISQKDKEKCAVVNDQDGEFWMPLSDFVANFQFVDICHLTPELCGVSDGTHGWDVHTFKGNWTKGVNAGGYAMELFHINPQYRITLIDTDDDEDDLCTILIGLRQRNKTRKIWNRIGFTAFRLEGEAKENNGPLTKGFIEENFDDSISSPFKRNREVVVRDKWEPGVYCIVPSTYTAGEEGQYYLRIFSEKKASTEEHGPSMDMIGLDPTKLLLPFKDKDTVTPNRTILETNENKVYEMFRTLAGAEKEIGWQGLETILNCGLINTQPSERPPKGLMDRLIFWLNSLFSEEEPETKLFTKEECRSLIGMMDDDRSGRMDFREFQILWSKLRSWESVFTNHSDASLNMTSATLARAMKEVDGSVKNSDISRLVRKYCDDHGKLKFDDFVMCCMELTTSKKA